MYVKITQRKTISKGTFLWISSQGKRRNPTDGNQVEKAMWLGENSKLLRILEAK